jgi:hypothetical protein
MPDPIDAPYAVVLTRASALSGNPGRVVIVLKNVCRNPVEVVSSAFEVKRAYSGSPHALPRVGWGYAVTAHLQCGAALPPESEYWTQFETDRRTVFGGVIPAQPSPEAGPHLYLCARLLYRCGDRRLYETAFYRRLVYPAMTFSLIEPADEGINYAGAIFRSP